MREPRPPVGGWELTAAPCQSYTGRWRTGDRPLTKAAKPLAVTQRPTCPTVDRDDAGSIPAGETVYTPIRLLYVGRVYDVGRVNVMEQEHGVIESYGDSGVKYTGGFVSCPECGSDAELIIWGEGVDASFECPECGEKTIIR